VVICNHGHSASDMLSTTDFIIPKIWRVVYEL